MTAFLPETLTAAALVLMLSIAVAGRLTGRFTWLTAVLASAVVLEGAVAAWSSEAALFSATYRIDAFSQGFKLVLALTLLITVLASRASSVAAEREPEYYFFLFSATLGMMMLTSAADLLTLYVALELSSYSLYVLSAFKLDRRSAEAGVKYLLFGAAASGLLLWGLSLIAGLSGTTHLAEIAQKAPALAAGEPIYLAALFLSLLALLFKLSAFPAHFWAPDVYESAPTPAVLFIATASKAAAVAILVRVFLWLGMPAGAGWALGFLAFVSMSLGNAVALVQTDVKRLLAYSSIAQAGYILVGLLAGSFEGYSSVIFYAAAYVLMNAAAFLVTGVVAEAARHDNPQLSHFDGLAERSPLLALVLLISLLSLAGIPPLAGFTGKWILFSAAMDKGHWFLVLWGVLNSVVSLFYYLTLVKHAYLEKPKEPGRLTVGPIAKGMAWALMLAIVLLGIFPDGVIGLCREAVELAAF